MGRRFFGTDGVRGVANTKLTPEFACDLGQAAGRWVLEQGGPRRVVIGRDTRRSGTMLGAALASGLCSVGVDVTTLGVAPTPTIAFAARTGDFAMGGIVSASHNPAPDNGIKFVGPDGRKLPDSVEEEIEALMGTERPHPTGSGVGRIENDESVFEQYLAHLEQIVPERLDGMKIAVDAAHGAAFRLGPEILARLGAEVRSIGISPDGDNINAFGGATKPGTIQAFTVEEGSQIGVAFDGDADRVVFSDERGALINGDRTLAAWALFHQRRNELDPAVVVGTVMSNGGYEALMTANGIRLERTPVGDKYVAQQIDVLGALAGGEQSGHIIFPRRGPTGDGLATMLEFLRVLKLMEKPASAITALYNPWPQLLVNIGVERMDGWRDAPGVADSLEQAEATLGSRGRIVVRPSGTQPMIRVMVEAEEAHQRDEVADRVTQALLTALGGEVHGRVDLTHALGD